MIITYLYDVNELDRMGDGFIVSLDKLSFNMPKSFSIDEINSIKNKTKKLVFLDLRPLYHESELKEVEDTINRLNNLDGYLFSDLGLVSYFKNNNLLSKAIYVPLTFNSTSYDIEFFKKANINNLVLSSDLTINRINEILNSVDDNIYSYIGLSYSQIFYSSRPHFKNYDSYYKTNNNLHNDFNVLLKEDTRNDYYHVVEDDRSFRIYKAKLFNSILDMDVNRFKYVFLDRLFIKDELYFDTINLYLNKITKNEYLNKYSLELFDNSILYNEVGLFKESK